MCRELKCLAEDLRKTCLRALTKTVHWSAGDSTRSASEYQAKPEAKLNVVKHSPTQYTAIWLDHLVRPSPISRSTKQAPPA